MMGDPKKQAETDLFSLAAELGFLDLTDDLYRSDLEQALAKEAYESELEKSAKQLT